MTLEFDVEVNCHNVTMLLHCIVSGH